MSTKSELEGTLEDGTGAGLGAQARLMSTGLRRLVSIVRDPNTLIIFINQTRSKIGGYGNPEVTTGGNALKFYSTQRIDLRRQDAIKNGDTLIGNTIKIKVIN